jgi:hypothetical protein
LVLAVVAVVPLPLLSPGWGPLTFCAYSSWLAGRRVD